MNKEDVIKIIKEQRYIGAIFRYGIIPVLLVMEDFEDNGDYEECQIILNAITYMNKHLPLREGEVELPTKYSKEVFKYIKSEFQKFGLRGDTYQANIPYYIEQITKMTKTP